jgi:hypothetical protein
MIKGDNLSSLGGAADISPTEAWAVGNVTEGPSPGQVIERWDGTQWDLFPGPSFAPGDQSALYTMTAISANDIWAVGSLVSNGLLNFLFEHWNGTDWTPITVPNDGAFLLGASSDATNDVWAVGYSGFLESNSTTLVYHYNGANWQSVPSPNVGGSDQLNAVVALAPNDVWAVGSSMVPNDPTLTLIEHYDGSQWSVCPAPMSGRPAATSRIDCSESQRSLRRTYGPSGPISPPMVPATR